MKYYVYFSLIPLHKVKIHLKTQLAYFISTVLDSWSQVCECEPGPVWRRANAPPLRYSFWSGSIDSES